ncbi:MAG: lipopolysaccharide biosynthesis protein [Nitrospira sp.]|jgi:O-antigen/teichoic acid export membrane protein|nr:lipopolysaccharide biosynthesis protein [Nitrospira sp.]
MTKPGKIVLAEQQPGKASARVSRELDRSLVHGMAWTGVMKWSGQLLTWVATILVARILTPDDYGIMAMAMAFIGIVGMISEFGVGSAVLNFRDLESDQVSQLNGISLMLGLGGFILSCLAAVPLSWFFKSDELTVVVIVLASGFIPLGMKGVPYALLQKEMRFKFLALVEGLQMLVQASSVVGFALLDFSYWALVLGSLVGTTMGAACLVGARPHGFSIPRFNQLREVLAYSWDVVGARILWYLYKVSDAFIVGRVLGQAALGAYSFGFALANMAVEKVSGMSYQVTTSLFGAVQHDHAALRRYLLILTEGFAVVSFPITIGLALVAEELVRVVFGEKWLPMTAPLQILALSASYRSISSIPGQVLFATKDSRPSLWNNALCAAIFPPACLVASHWGTVGIAMVWALIHPPLNYRLSAYVFRAIGLAHGQYWRSLIPAAVASLAMTLTVIGVKYGMPSDWPLPVRLGTEVCLGGISYILMAFLFYRAHLQKFIALVRSQRQG